MGLSAGTLLAMQEPSKTLTLNLRRHEPESQRLRRHLLQTHVSHHAFVFIFGYIYHRQPSQQRQTDEWTDGISDASTSAWPLPHREREGGRRKSSSHSSSSPSSSSCSFFLVFRRRRDGRTATDLRIRFWGDFDELYPIP